MSDDVHPVLKPVLDALSMGYMLKSCEKCGSRYCGPIRCRFEDTEALSRPAEGASDVESA